MKYLKSSIINVSGLRRGVVVYEDLEIEGNKVVVRGTYVKVSGVLTLLNINYYNEEDSVDIVDGLGLEGVYMEYSQLRGGYMYTDAGVFYRLKDVIDLSKRKGCK